MITAPGQVTVPAFRRALVLAPHYDDEILGCGGLVARWLEGGAEVQVLYLSDGAGGSESLEERTAYAGERRLEAERVAATWGFSIAGHLGLPDGSLANALEALAEGLRAAFLEHRPEVVLVPSPLEASKDHRATFAALHRVLSSLRPGDPLEKLATDSRVLVYEINHPFYPELLVDVGRWLPQLGEAMEIYASQQRRHDYLSAALGLRRFRTLTLDPEVRAAEGYVELWLRDFTTRSLAQLTERLGGQANRLEVREGPLISVVVRTRDRPQLLAEALASLAENSYRRAEVVLVNDGGSAPSVSSDFPLPIVSVELETSRGRAGAAQAGVEAANGAWITFLDDDDLAAPEHLATLAGLVEAAGVRVAYTDAAVGIYALGEAGGGWRCVERRLPYSRDFDPDLLRLDNYIPFNTLIVERRLLLDVGGFDLELPFFEDWDLLIRLSSEARFHHLPRVTCEYRHFRAEGHHVFGERPDQRQDFLEVKAQVLAKHGAGDDLKRLARVVDLLRAESVEQGEATAARLRDLERLRERVSLRDDEYHRLNTRHHRLNGRLESLQGDYLRLENDADEQKRQLLHHAAEEEALRTVTEGQEQHLAKLYPEIERLEAAVEEQGEHLGRTYAEIQRLNALIESLEQTRGMRAQRWLERRRG